MKTLIISGLFVFSNLALADWPTVLKCSSTDSAHPTFAVTMTLPKTLPTNGSPAEGATMAVSEDGKGGSPIPAIVTVSSESTVAVMGLNGFACVVSQVKAAMKGSCAFVATGPGIDISCN